jgi:hypothetical protein
MTLVFDVENEDQEKWGGARLRKAETARVKGVVRTEMANRGDSAGRGLARIGGAVVSAAA